MPPLTCRIKRGVAVLTLTCLPLRAGMLRAALAALGRAGCRHAVLDLKEVAPDLTLVKPLMALRRRLGRVNGRLVLCGLSVETADWLRSTWLQGLFEVCPDAASALACLAS